jgi:hypothetical protein
MKQPAAMKEARSMVKERKSRVKERWLDHRIEKLSRENEGLRDEVDELRHDLDETRDRSADTIKALARTRRPGRMKWLVLAGGAYVLGAKAGRARYEQIRDWARSITQRDGDGTTVVPESERTNTELPGTTLVP